MKSQFKNRNVVQGRIPESDRPSQPERSAPISIKPLVKSGIVLGLGFGGFADGIVLHQILGWHHLVCITEHCQPTSIEHLQRQNTQDGFFHLAVWIISLIGTFLLFRAAKQGGLWSGRTLAGAMLIGWGIFNFVEGFIDHQILGIHHVLPGHPRQLLWDLMFLATGPFFAAIGYWLIQSGKRQQLWKTSAQPQDSMQPRTRTDQHG